MRKLAASLALAAGTFVLTNPSPALALPSGCSAWNVYPSRNHPTDGGQAQCTRGTGHVRAIVYCTKDPQTGWGSYYYSTWVSVGQKATKYCPYDKFYVVSTGYERAP
ncbi:hypothetical protein GCM10022248_15070 [Nonomuraea soli]